MMPVGVDAFAFPMDGYDCRRMWQWEMICA